MSIILATQEAEIKRITEVQSQPGEKSSKKNTFLKNPSPKRAGGETKVCKP
jgi:hypothetical protein